MKKLVVVLSILLLCFANIGLAYSSSSNIEKFLSIFSSISSDKRDLALSIVGSYLETDDGIDQLVKNIDVLIGPYKDKIISKGITVDEVKSGLNELKNYTPEQRQALIDAAKAGDTAKIREILNGSKSNSSQDQSSSGQGSDNGANSGTVGVEPPSDKDSSANSESGQHMEIDGKVITFKDIKGHWAQKDIEFLASKGIIKGVSKDSFNPEGYVTRAQFVALLVRVLNLKPVDGGKMSFKDVKATDWYYKDVQAAYNNRIIAGSDDGNFYPNRNMSREEMAVFLSRALENLGKYKALDQSASFEILKSYKDEQDISDWAKNYVAGVIDLEIMQGRSSGVFDPKAKCTRAESAKVIKKLYDIVSR